MLADATLITELRPDAPSTTEDSTWNALNGPYKYSVFTDGEKLASANE